MCPKCSPERASVINACTKIELTEIGRVGGGCICAVRLVANCGELKAAVEALRKKALIICVIFNTDTIYNDNRKNRV